MPHRTPPPRSPAEALFELYERQTKLPPLPPDPHGRTGHSWPSAASATRPRGFIGRFLADLARAVTNLVAILIKTALFTIAVIVGIWGIVRFFIGQTVD